MTKTLITLMKLGAAAYLAGSALTDMEQEKPRLSITLRYRRKIREQEKIIEVLGETIKDLKYKQFYPKTLEQMVEEGQITPELAEEIREMKRKILHDRHLD